jgi:hypothetical protein
MKRRGNTGNKATHSEIQNAVCHLLALLEIPYSVTDAARVWNRHGRVTAQKVRTGWPDITAVLPPHGQAAFLEVKTDADQVRPVQQEVLVALAAAGAKCGVVRSLADAVEWLTHWLQPDSSPAKKLARVEFGHHHNVGNPPPRNRNRAPRAFDPAGNTTVAPRERKTRGDA